MKVELEHLGFNNKISPELQIVAFEFKPIRESLEKFFNLSK